MSERECVLLEAARAICPHCAAGYELLYAVPDPRFGAWSHRKPIQAVRGAPYTVPVGCKAGAIQELRAATR